MCVLPLYEWLVFWIQISITFNRFEVEIINHLKPTPSQLHPTFTRSTTIVMTEKGLKPKVTNPNRVKRVYIVIP